MNIVNKRLCVIGTLSKYKCRLARQKYKISAYNLGVKFQSIWLLNLSHNCKHGRFITTGTYFCRKIWLLLNKFHFDLFLLKVNDLLCPSYVSSLCLFAVVPLNKYQLHWKSHTIISLGIVNTWNSHNLIKHAVFWYCTLITRMIKCDSKTIQSLWKSAGLPKSQICHFR